MKAHQPENTVNLEQQLNGNQSRRMASQDRFLAAIDRREANAERMIGELCREGRTVYYVSPQGGRHREGTQADLIAFLIRNNYA